VRWVLVNAGGTVVRETDAGSLAEARFRLAPLNGCQVLSWDSYQLGRDMDVRPMLTTKGKPRKHGAERWGVNEVRRRLILAANVELIPDEHIGKEFGVTGEAVSQMRKKLGLPSVDERMRMQVRAYWTLGWDDRRIAARIGMSASNLMRNRKRMGLPSRRPWGNQSVPWDKDAVALDYDVTPTAVEAARTRNRRGKRGDCRPRTTSQE